MPKALTHQNTINKISENIRKRLSTTSQFNQFTELTSLAQGQWVDHICFSAEHCNRNTQRVGMNKAKKYQYSKRVISMITLGEKCGIIVLFADGTVQAIKMVQKEWIKEGSRIKMKGDIM